MLLNKNPAFNISARDSETKSLFSKADLLFLEIVCSNVVMKIILET